MSNDQSSQAKALDDNSVRVVHTTEVNRKYAVIPAEWIAASNTQTFEDNKAMFGDLVDQCPTCQRTRILSRKTGTYLCAVCDSGAMPKDVER